MKAAIMQPYFLPYIGYFQLIQAVDVFVIYDNIKYTKSGWINRNRFLQNGSDVVFSVSLKKDSDFCTIGERFLADGFDREHLLGRFRGAYQRAPFFDQAFPVIERVVSCADANLFGYIHHSLREICAYLGITTSIVVSSGLQMDHGLKGQDKVLALCEALGATSYLNAIGGLELYSRDTFRARGIELRFLKSRPFEYPQFDHDFVPWLSIIDVMMFNSPESIRQCLECNYDLV